MRARNIFMRKVPGDRMQQVQCQQNGIYIIQTVIFNSEVLIYMIKVSD